MTIEQRASHPFEFRHRTFARLKVEFSPVHRAAAAELGVNLDHTQRNTFASRAIIFAAANRRPPAKHSILVDFTIIRGRPTYAPYVRFNAATLFFDFTVRGNTPNWRVRDPRKAGKTGTVRQKARLASIFGRLGFPPPKGTQGFWAPVPAAVLERVHPFVREFLDAIAAHGKADRCPIIP